MAVSLPCIKGKHRRQAESVTGRPCPWLRAPLRAGFGSARLRSGVGDTAQTQWVAHVGHGSIWALLPTSRPGPEWAGLQTLVRRPAAPSRAGSLDGGGEREPRVRPFLLFLPWDSQARGPGSVTTPKGHLPLREPGARPFLPGLGSPHQWSKESSPRRPSQLYGPGTPTSLPLLPLRLGRPRVWKLEERGGVNPARGGGEPVLLGPQPPASPSHWQGHHDPEKGRTPVLVPQGGRGAGPAARGRTQTRLRGFPPDRRRAAGLTCHRRALRLSYAETEATA